jgi:hypothetical protein
MLWADRPKRRRFLSFLAITQVAFLVAMLIAPVAALAEEPPPPDQPAPPGTLTTDKPDYAPGETVAVTGTGFEPGVSYAIPVLRPDGSIVLGDGSFVAGWDTATADGTGTIGYSYQLNGIDGTYEVRAYPVDWTGDWAAAPLTSVTFTDVTMITIQGNKFHDLNASGTWQEAQSPYEPSLNGWQVDLLDFETGALVASTTTASPKGVYQFTPPVPPSGEFYRICEVLQTGFTQTRPYSGATFGSGVAAPCPAGYAAWGWKIRVTQANLNFGNINLVANGTKWEDLNGDGTRQAGEPGVQGVTIKAYAATDTTGTTVLASVDTDVNGDYNLTLPPLSANATSWQYLVCEFTAGS